VIVVCLITVPLNNLIYNFVLREDALEWAGIYGTNLKFVSLISYIGVIAAVVQILEMFLINTYQPYIMRLVYFFH
jgi:Na+-transporting NADH:ubiquinone oxidoreductase subunit E